MLPVVQDNWKMEIFTNSLNTESLVPLFKLKESLIKFEDTIWVDIHNHYESKIRIENIFQGLITMESRAGIRLKH